MFNHFRSTERHLKLLAIPFGIKKTVSGNVKSKFSSRPRPRTQNRSNNIIKLNQSRPLTTITDSFTPIMNPNKPDPQELNEANPIVPLTATRFPKASSTWPSVTKILQETMPAASKFLLDRWKEAMIKKLGTVGFNKYQQETFERGRILHSLVASYLLRHDNPTDITMDIVSNLWKSIENVVKENISNVRLVEHVVTHPDLKYRGIVDCVAFYKGELVVIDFKTAEKPKKTIESLFDNPIQVTAYCGAINNDINIPVSVIDRNICSGLVIVAYIDGSEASVHYLGRDKVTNEYWKKWTTRLDQFTRMKAMQIEDNDAR
uniref:Mitochondrial genome maintenance exonuclease 1 n=1 Tax=Aceria tosichella TaxID=561515 RepID=A0A6G1SP05_9ACAR